VLTDGLTTSVYGTDRCVITVDGNGENTILSLIDAARHFDPVGETPIAACIKPGDLVVMQGNLRPSLTRDCLALARSKGATTVLNPSPTYAAQDYDWTLADLLARLSSPSAPMAPPYFQPTMRFTYRRRRSTRLTRSEPATCSAGS
jgi:sugar/nucleoside kinase (ribokinase family)